MSSPQRPSTAAALRLDFRHRSELASETRRYLLEVLRQRLSDPEDADCVAMAIHELIENLVKYSNNESSSVEVDVDNIDGAMHVVVRTRNSVTPERLSELERALTSVTAAPDPVALYDELIASSPARSNSGLGLARIRAEADMNLSYTVDGQEVTVVAERVVPARRFT